MAKTELLWLSRDGDERGDMAIWAGEKPCKENRVWCRDVGLGTLCVDAFYNTWLKFAPAFKLRKGRCIKIKKTLLKNGFKLEKI